MSEYLYRFRSPERLLGESGELERQEIYFASPEQLNDPLEGRKNIYWQGDRIVWENLFRHYIMCLMAAYGFVGLKPKNDPPKWHEIPIRDPYGPPGITVLDRLRSCLNDSFFSNSGVQAYVDAVANSQHRIRQSELGVHLNSINQVALVLIDFLMHQRSEALEVPAESEPSVAAATERLRAMASNVQQITTVSNGNENLIDAAYAAQQNSLDQLNLINLYNGDIDRNEKGKIFLAVDFPNGYVRQLETLMHPPWFAACFMQNCTDAAMWGYYGASHSGVCLKFRTQNTGDHLSLKLRTLVGEGGAGRIYEKRPHRFLPVTYDSSHIEMNFFTTIGWLPIPILNRQWYTDSDGNRSNCFPVALGQDEKFREKYWLDFNIAATTKTKAWEPESEYRLVLHSLLFDLSVEDRKLQYDFDDLEGIIFGIRTTLEHKLKISEIIEAKCKSSGRQDFKFYQAYFSRQTGEIACAPMSLLKFQ